MTKKLLILALVLYVISAAVSYGVFSYIGKPTSLQISQTEEVGEDGETALSQLLEIDPSEPLDQPCPLNGKLYTQTERNAWEQRRPLAVMIENAPDARPQSGLGKADVVFEAVAEGGVTRFMALYLCGAQRADLTLAPIRSARTYFVELASIFNRPLYVHVGGSNIGDFETNALEYLSYVGWTAANDLNQFSIGYPTFVRNYNRLPGKDLATEHTMETTTEALWEVGEDREWTNMSPERKVGTKVVAGANWYDEFEPWLFQTENPTPGSVTEISHDFWSGYDQYRVRWVYNPETNAYKRFMGGEEHVDLNDNKQIEASSVIVFLTDEKGPVDEKKHMIYETNGRGDALIFQNGSVIEATWSKKDFGEPLSFTDDKGADVEFSPGLIWVAVVDASTDVDY